jgi:hypothetical protein
MELDSPDRFVARSAFMQYTNPEKLPGELIRLMEKQIDSLEKQTFERVTDAERNEYEQRQKHIDELCEKLRYLHAAA